MNKNTNKIEKIIRILLFIIIAIGLYFNLEKENQIDNTEKNNIIVKDLLDIKEYNGQAYVQINNNIPKFTAEDIALEKDYYSDLENQRVRNGYDKN